MAYRKYISERTPIFPVAMLLGMIAFLSGVFSAGIEVGIWNSFLIAAGFGFFARVKRLPIVVIIAMPLIFLTGAWYYHFYFTVQQRLNTIPEGNVVVSGVVAGSVGATVTGGEYFPLAFYEPYRGTVRVIARASSFPHYGDILEINGTIRRGIVPHEESILFADEMRYTGKIHGKVFVSALNTFKQKLIVLFHESLPFEEAALAAGITLGDKAGFTASFREAMKKSGTTHIVALSGYNIVVLVGAIFGIILFIAPRRIASVITILTIISFVVMTGSEESVVRAAIMGALLLVAKEVGRAYSVSHALSITAVSMAFYDPSVLFAPGSQLSFASVLGLVYVEPVFKEWWNARASRIILEDTRSIRDHLFATLSAQWAALPIIMVHFGSFPLAAFFANILILPLMPITMFFGFLVLGTSLVLQPLSYFVAWILRAVLIYEEAVIRIFSGFDIFSSGIISPLIILSFYALVFIFIVRYYMKRAQSAS